MMEARLRTVSVYDAKTHLSQLLAEVEGGEEVVITRNGAPVARLVRAVPPARNLDGLRGLVLDVAPDAFDPLSDAEVAALGAAPLVSDEA